MNPQRAGAKARTIAARPDWPTASAAAGFFSTLAGSPFYRDREVVADGVVHVLGIGFGLFAAASLTFVTAPAVTLLVIGGVIYTTGVLFHLWERLPFNKAIWHGFVLAAAVCHFAAITAAMATVAQ